MTHHAAHGVDWWVRHVLGIDSQQTAFYMFWSGPGPCIVGLAGVALAWWAIRIALSSLRIENEQLSWELEQAQKQLEAQEDESGRT